MYKTTVELKKYPAFITIHPPRHPFTSDRKQKRFAGIGPDEALKKVVVKRAAKDLAG